MAGRGAGVSAGGSRAICVDLTGVQPVGDAIFIGFKVFNCIAVAPDDGDGVDGGGLADFLIITIFFFAIFCWPFVSTTFDTLPMRLATLVNPGNGRSAGFGVVVVVVVVVVTTGDGDDDADANIIF